MGEQRPASASTGERERLLADFTRLCEIASPSGRERTMADAVGADLRELGLEVHEDASAAETGSDAGNLLARIGGPEGARTILLCAHLDTVPLAAPVEVVREDGYLFNRHDGILGADNKAAVAVLLAVARRLVRDGSPVGVELLFTTCEETSLGGAKAFDRGLLRSEFGFVFDHATPIGELIVAAPSHYLIDATFIGQAAHAGIRPERGHNAVAAAARAIASMPLGRLDDETTANVGLIDGGSAVNVVAERCRVQMETRSLDHARAGEVVSMLVDALTAGACDGHCDVETAVQEEFRAYRLGKSSPPVVAAGEALAALGIEPRHVATGGASDAHVFVERGLPCLNVANGTEANHEPGERVTVHALETMLDVTLGIVARSA